MKGRLTSYRSNLGSKPWGRGVYVCQHLSLISDGKTTEGKSRSEPEPGNLAFRDRRGACGNMLQWFDNHLPRSRKRWIQWKLLA
jgi:hypothetical protein